ncbi:MAG: glycosyltransferase family 1 protein, partial [Chloroflexi bacterium]|nr:glycosyltransferase family 1 protein [Chloroflexota bacterium]
MITHGIDGLLVRPRDTMDLANGLTQLVLDADRRASLAAAGRRRVEEYSWPHVVQQVISYYERLLDSQRGSRLPAYITHPPL